MDVTGQDPLVMSLVKDVAHAGEINGADAVIETVAESFATDYEEEDDGDDGD